MSFADFRKLYGELQHVPKNAKSIENKFNKLEISKLLSTALEALKHADNIVVSEVDKILNAIKSYGGQNLSMEQRQPLFADFERKPPPVIMLPMESSRNPPNDREVRTKISKTLEKVKVDKCRLTPTGTVIIDVPTLEDRENAAKYVKTALKDTHCISEPIKKNPKLLLTHVSDEYPDDSIIPLICNKDSFIYKKRQEGTSFRVLTSWKSRNNKDKAFRNVVIECSKEIRNRIMDNNKGRINFGLSRHEVLDYVSPKQCFHCQRFNHIAVECREKDKPQVCGLCADEHDTRSCPGARGGYRKCINCSRAGREDCDPYHSARSASCPIFQKTKKNILGKMCLDYE